MAMDSCDGNAMWSWSKVQDIVLVPIAWISVPKASSCRVGHGSSQRYFIGKKKKSKKAEIQT
jgi:hypothetical protein